MLKVFFKKLVKHLRWFADSYRDYFRFKKIYNDSFYVFISHNGDSAGGAPVVMFELMRSLKDGKNMVLLCEKPGEIIESARDSGIYAYSMYLNRKKYLKLVKNKGARIVVVNTVVAYSSLKLLNGNINCPIFWWLHEENKLLDRYSDLIPESLSPNVKILCVSERVRDGIINIMPEFKNITEIFYYGCKDLYDEEEDKKPNNVFTISVIGRICERKNQLQVIDAYDLLPQEIRENTVIQFVASSSEDSYLNKLKDRVDNNRNIHFTGAVQREKMPEVYKNSSLIICSSIDDPLPVVITEAMMYKRAFITSSSTGQYSLIQNNVNGFVYDINSTEQLSEQIINVYKSDNLEQIEDNARKTYLEYFTYEKVKINFEKLLSESVKENSDEK